MRLGRVPRRCLTTMACLVSSAVVMAACSTDPAPTKSATPTDPTTASSPADGGVPSPTAQQAAQKKPNIVLLMTDDQALSDMSVMPKTRRLIGAAGVTFSRAFSSYPLCCPARTTMLTGQQAHNHGVMGNDPPWGGYGKFRDEKATLAVWLRAAGYRTTMLGKYLNGYPVPGKETFVPPGWTNWLVPVVGAYRYDKYTINQNGRLQSYSKYQARYVADRVSGLVETESATDQPFFLWASFLAPHVGMPVEPDDPRSRDREATDTPSVEPKYRDSLRGLRLPVTPAVNEGDMSDKSTFMTRQPPRPIADLREAYQQRLESLRSVDDAVEQIIGSLKRAGSLRDTYVMFVSDNGFLVGQHRRFNKVFGYEESIRVPLMMRGPGIPANSTVDQQVSLVDLSATVASIAGAKPSHDLDGVSLLPMIGHPELFKERPMLLEAGGWPFPNQTRLYTGVRTADDVVMLKWYDGVREIYDLKSDPLQLDGTASAQEMSQEGRLAGDLQVLEDCAGVTCNELPDP